MSLACTKSYTLTVAVPITTSAYWKLDEAAGSVPRVASVSPCNFLPLGVTSPGTPALIGNGVVFDATVGSNNYTTFAYNAALGYTAPNGWSMWGWFRCDATGWAGGLGNGGFEIGFSAGLHGIRLSVGSSLDVTPFRVETHWDTVYFNTTLGVWHFFFLFYDGTLHQHGYSIDNGPQSTLPTANIMGTVAGGLCTLSNDWMGATGYIIWDELGVCMTERLSLTQLAFLYNGGAGRTYPF